MIAIIDYTFCLICLFHYKIFLHEFFFFFFFFSSSVFGYILENALKKILRFTKGVNHFPNFNKGFSGQRKLFSV
jgi:hypothetical protein